MNNSVVIMADKTSFSFHFNNTAYQHNQQQQQQQQQVNCKSIATNTHRETFHVENRGNNEKYKYGEKAQTSTKVVQPNKQFNWIRTKHWGNETHALAAVLAPPPPATTIYFPNGHTFGIIVYRILYVLRVLNRIMAFSIRPNCVVKDMEIVLIECALNAITMKITVLRNISWFLSLDEKSATNF